MGDEVDFLPADQDFGSVYPGMPKGTKITSSQYLCKRVRMKLIFCLEINIKGFFILMLSF